MENVHTINELKQLQAMPLPVKVAMTQTRVRAWVEEFGVDGVYISFSGGKDSTVLLNIVRNLYPEVRAMFIDTGLEYPEIREFVKTFDNVDWIKPAMNFRKVIDTYGYPFISKAVSHKVSCVMKNKNSNYAKFFNESTRGSIYNCEKYKFLLDAPFKIGCKCCDVMKKTPAHNYNKQSKRVPITGQMADESLFRTKTWLKHGCNIFDSKNPVSNPLSFWTEQDILKYIQINNLPICSVYGNIVADNGSEDFEGQMDISELGVIEDNRILKTTGCDRTGCMFCGYGCHIEKGKGRFERMKETHPKQYDYIMRPKEEGGLNYKAVIDWINEHSDLDIKY